MDNPNNNNSIWKKIVASLFISLIGGLILTYFIYGYTHWHEICYIMTHDEGSYFLLKQAVWIPFFLIVVLFMATGGIFLLISLALVFGGLEKAIKWSVNQLK